MKVIICGSRHIRNPGDIKHLVLAIKRAGFLITEVVSGTCRGADQLGEVWAKAKGIPVKQFPADWDNVLAPGAYVKRTSSGHLYNAKAGPERNSKMVEYADAVIALFCGKSTGTADTCRKAERKGIPVFKYYVTGIGKDD